MTARALALLAIAACASGSSHQHAQLAHLGFDVPADWHRADSNLRGLATSVWTPEDNSKKESITIVRSERRPAVASAGLATVQRLLGDAQPPNARLSMVMPVFTRQGLAGARVEADYVPPGLTATYHRVHVVLVDGTSFVHVLYTSPDPRPDLDTFNTVLSSIREESQS